MVSQQEQLKERVERIKDVIRDSTELPYQELESWALLNLGITSKTLGSYVMALDNQQIVHYDFTTKIVKWVLNE